MPPVDVEVLIPELTRISGEWLTAKGQREAQFSSGCFDEAYLRLFPCAVVETAPANGAPGRAIGFANILHGPRREELSVDLMRCRRGWPGAMDYLMVSLMLYGQRMGYERFNLGMAPFANVGYSQGAHWGERLGRCLFLLGEPWYNYRGLRRYKEKFHPTWVPRYLAYSGALQWPIAMANVGALVAGGWARLIGPPAVAFRRHS